MARIATSLLLLVALAACSSEPPTDAVRAAIQSRLRDDISNMTSLAQQIGGEPAVGVLRALGSPAPETLRVEHIEILDSRAFDDGDYGLRVRYDIVTPDASRTVTRELLLDKTGDGWRATPRSRGHAANADSSSRIASIDAALTGAQLIWHPR